MTRPEILDTAKKCVCGDREQDYGTPEDNFKTIADLWSAYFRQEFTAVDVAVFLSLVKIGRIASGHGKADNWIDLAGYAACGGEIESAIVAELERLKLSEADEPKTPYDTYLEEMGEEDVSEQSEPVKGKYEGCSNEELAYKICCKVKCVDCPIPNRYGSEELFFEQGCDTWGDDHPEEFRKIAIEHLEGLEGKA